MTQRAENSYLRSLSLKLTNRHTRLTGPDMSQNEKVLTGLQARTPVHEDGGRDHDAPLAHFVLCGTGFNSSWSWRNRRCEVIRIGDRDDAGQIASSTPMRTPVSGDRAFGYIVNSPGPMGSVRVKLTTGHKYLSMRMRRYWSLRTSCCSSTQV